MKTTSTRLETYPDLETALIQARFALSLGESTTPEDLLGALELSVDAPLAPNDEVRGAVRDLFRHRGYKPTGRGKPASEYLLKMASGEGMKSINLAVDTNNVVSLHSGLPISVVDLDLVENPESLLIRIPDPESSYIFNQSGQEMKLDGLLCLHDEVGACANAVKDSQRTKTHDGTREVLYVIWGTEKLPGRTQQAADWMVQWLKRCDAECAAEVVRPG